MLYFRASLGCCHVVAGARGASRGSRGRTVLRGWGGWDTLGILLFEREEGGDKVAPLSERQALFDLPVLPCSCTVPKRSLAWQMWLKIAVSVGGEEPGSWRWGCQPGPEHGLGMPPNSVEAAGLVVQ